MKKLPLKTALYHMARMWAGMARTGQATKPELGIRSRCFLCEYFRAGLKPENSEKNGGCTKCSETMKEVWPSRCGGTNSLYQRWYAEKLKKERQKYARKIADEAWKQWRLIK